MNLVSLDLKNNTKAKSVFKTLLYIVLFSTISFFAGRFSGSQSCDDIDVDRIKKSIDVTQKASTETARFTVTEKQTITELQEQLKEVQDDVKDTAMPADVIDLLNQ